MTQRITMVLLLLLVIGVWGLLLRPVVTPVPVQAQEGGNQVVGGGNLVAAPYGLYLYTRNGVIYHLATDLSIRDRAVPPNIGNPTMYTIQHQPK